MKKLFSKLDKPLLITTFIFFVFGLIMVFSSSSMESYMRYNYSPYHYFIRQLIFLILGIFIFLFCILFPTKNYKRIEKILLLVVIISLIGLIFYGYAANQAISWYKIGTFAIQPSEFAKVIIIIYMATYYYKNFDSLDNHLKVLKPLIPVIIICMLVAMQPDLGTAFIIGTISLFIFYGVPLSKNKRSIFNKIFIGGILLVVLLLITSGSKLLKPYQLQRLNFREPCERYQEESGYQLCNSFIAFRNGKITGQGLGKSTQKYLYLPESYTDFIFPIIVEELGLIVGVIIISAYMFILYRILRIARRATNLKNSLICYGVFAYILSHVMVNLFGVMGLIPLTGVPLPFLSYGGSYTICLTIAIGLVERVAIETNKTKTIEK